MDEQTKGKMMQIKNITAVGKKKVYDISVEEVEHYVLENGVVTHNTGLYYSANQIFFVGRSQEKEGTDIVGYNFTINIEKSRFVKEKSKLAFNVNFDSGINKWSGLMDLALESGHCVKPKNGWYARVDKDTGETDEKNWRLGDTHCKEFWLPVITDKSFQDFVKCKYQLAQTEMLHFDDEGEE